ncbi:uncharacterized protein LOC130648867 [Hydractinia symbiolongicarpus]|uniref:uncharacterized protein LOC130648867 n=1 Tax=Hydractinia symbiolongicarpus TaxID=13093 RepID=UPI002550B38D|nr:uncharacterized protein LOC130648867 [Hydractinia symbiolongicarpus]
MDLPTVELAAILECKICLDTYYKPKILNCGHAYCQDCLDDILVFQNDGSAELPCPLRCTKKTILSKEETTSSLTAVYTFAVLLDKMLLNGKEKLLCQQSKECKQIISCHCTTCGAKICEQCRIMHSCAENKYVDILFNEKLQEIQPFCKQHKSFAKFVCTDCDNSFVCVYCIQRDHKTHRKKKIDEVGEETKEWFKSLVTSFHKKKFMLETLTGKYNDALKIFKTDREKFVHELKVRKLKRIEEYLKMLNAEEENLLKEFDKKTEQFKAKLISTGFVDDRKLRDFSDYVNVLNLKSPFEIVSEKKLLEQRFCRLFSFPANIPHFKSQFYGLNKQEDFKNPLGQMQVSITDVNVDGLDPNTISIYNNLIVKTQTQPNQTQLEADLMNLVEDVKEYGQHHTYVNRHSEQQKIWNVEKKTRSSKYYTFEELVEIIKNGEDKKFRSIICNDPNVIFLRSNHGNTLLMEASRYNKFPVVKYLIEAGEDVKDVDDSKWNAYHYSTRYGSHDVLKLLINHDDTNINDVNNYNETPLHFACRRGLLKCVNLLLTISHLNVNVQNDNGKTPLHMASTGGHVECVRSLLLAPYIDVNMRDHNNNTAYDITQNEIIKNLLVEHRRE